MATKPPTSNSPRTWYEELPGIPRDPYLETFVQRVAAVEIISVQVASFVVIQDIPGEISVPVIFLVLYGKETTSTKLEVS